MFRRLAQCVVIVQFDSHFLVPKVGSIRRAHVVCIHFIGPLRVTDTWDSHSQMAGGFIPFQKYESIGMSIPKIWKNNINVSNHQSAKWLVGWCMALLYTRLIHFGSVSDDSETHDSFPT